MLASRNVNSWQMTEMGIVAHLESIPEVVDISHAERAVEERHVVLDGVTKVYRSARALDNVTLAVHQGEFLAILDRAAAVRPQRFASSAASFAPIQVAYLSRAAT